MLKYQSDLKLIINYRTEGILINQSFELKKNNKLLIQEVLNDNDKATAGCYNFFLNTL